MEKVSKIAVGEMMQSLLTLVKCLSTEQHYFTHSWLAHFVIDECCSKVPVQLN